MNILFTCAGRRNYLINYFKDALNGQGKVFASDMQRTAPALIDADIGIEVPGIYEKSYIPALKQIIIQNKIRAVIPLNDLELPLLSKAKKDLEELGTKIIVADENVISICFDKWKTVSFLLENGLKTPQTFISYKEAVDALQIKELTFPVVLKPRWGSASIGIEFPEDEIEMDLSFQLLNRRLIRTILKEASNEDIDHAILIQEKMSGIEYGMDVLNDFKGNYVGTFVRKKLSMRSGETDKAVSIIDERFEKVGRKIGTSLRHIGNLDCDVFEYKGELYVLEMNPRFGGGYPFSHEAGMNTAASFIEWLKGGEDIEMYRNYKADMMFSKCDRLMRIR